MPFPLFFVPFAASWFGTDQMLQHPSDVKWRRKECHSILLLLLISAGYLRSFFVLCSIVRSFFLASLHAPSDNLAETIYRFLHVSFLIHHHHPNISFFGPVFECIYIEYDVFIRNNRMMTYENRHFKWPKSKNEIYLNQIPIEMNTKCNEGRFKARGQFSVQRVATERPPERPTGRAWELF